MSLSKNTSIKKSADKEKSSALIYCGPNLPQGILNQFTVYREGLPKHLDKYMDDCQAIRRLFVPTEQFTQSFAACQTSGTAENVWFKEVEAYARGGAKS